MPGLRLTQIQAQRLWNLDARTCEDALRHLVEVRFLSRTLDGLFARSPEAIASLRSKTAA
jgi:hypothetical protein